MDRAFGKRRRAVANEIERALRNGMVPKLRMPAISCSDFRE